MRKDRICILQLIEVDEVIRAFLHLVLGVAMLVSWYIVFWIVESCFLHCWDPVACTCVNNYIMNNLRKNCIDIQHLLLDVLWVQCGIASVRKVGYFLHCWNVEASTCVHNYNWGNLRKWIECFCVFPVSHRGHNSKWVKELVKASTQLFPHQQVYIFFPSQQPWMGWQVEVKSAQHSGSLVLKLFSLRSFIISSQVTV